MSRFTAVRRLRHDGWGPPELLDYGTKTARPGLRPNPGPCLERSRHGDIYADWVRTAAGVWLPAIAGGLFNGLQTPRLAMSDFPSTLTLTATNLSTAYTFNSAGAAVAHRFTWPIAKTMTALYYYTGSVVGTPTLVDFEAYRNNTNTTPVTGATSLGTTTHVPSTTANRWSKVTWALGSIGGHATDRYVWIIMGDADGSSSNRIAVNRFNALMGGRSQYITAQSFGTTAGWTGTPTNDTQQSMLVLIFDDGKASGSPFATSTFTIASSTQQGLRINGLVNGMSLRGWRTFVGSGAITSAYVWEDTGGPSAGTNLVSGITKSFPGAGSGGTEFTLLATPVTLAAATQYRLTNASASMGLQRHQVGTLISGTAAELMTAVLGGGEFYYTFESGGAWTNNTSEYPVFELIFEDQITSGGGTVEGGLRVAGRGGLAAGV